MTPLPPPPAATRRPTWQTVEGAIHIGLGALWGLAILGLFAVASLFFGADGTTAATIVLLLSHAGAWCAGGLAELRGRMAGAWVARACLALFVIVAWVVPA